MYCIQCGVKLADSETVCPLCKTRVFHPDISQKPGEKLFPSDRYPARTGRGKLPEIFLTVAFLLPLLIVLACDLRFSGAITWSGYVIGALVLAYTATVLPSWFQKPNPVIFVPCNFAAAGIYLAYINFITEGDWFLTFAFPITGVVALLVTALVTLLRYVRGGRLFIVGGFFVGLGLFSLLIEFLIILTFSRISFMGWSLYPAVTLLLFGGLLLFLGICRPARESMEKKFFI